MGFKRFQPWLLTLLTFLVACFPSFSDVNRGQSRGALGSNPTDFRTTGLGDACNRPFHVFAANVLLDGKFWTGSGTIVHPDGYILTAAHLIDGEDRAGNQRHVETFEVRIGERPDQVPSHIYSATLVQGTLDLKQDLALLKIDNPPKEGFNYFAPVVLSQKDLRTREELCSVGFSARTDIRLVKAQLYGGKLTGKSDGLLQAEMLNDNGRSGGGVFNASGDLVGVISKGNTRTANETTGKYSVTLFQTFENYQDVLKKTLPVPSGIMNVDDHFLPNRQNGTGPDEYGYFTITKSTSCKNGGECFHIFVDWNEKSTNPEEQALLLWTLPKSDQSEYYNDKSVYCDLSGAKQVTVEARGATGKEVIHFYAAFHKDFRKDYKVQPHIIASLISGDSLKYVIPLEGQRLDKITVPFSIGVARKDNSSLSRVELWIDRVTYDGIDGRGCPLK
jgi:hypothetical protein